jgi:hypothetical protein
MSPFQGDTKNQILRPQSIVGSPFKKRTYWIFLQWLGNILKFHPPIPFPVHPGVNSECLNI